MARPGALRLWQQPMNKQRVKSDHHQSENYNQVIHSFCFLSADSVALISICGLARFVFGWANIVRRARNTWFGARNAHDLASTAERS